MVMKRDDNQLKAYMGEDAVFNGSLSFEGTVRIDGKFEGQVKTADTLIIGETGQVSAEVMAGTVICKGRLEGTIIASEKIEIHANSQVAGSIKTPSLLVEVGAVLDGNCQMSAGEGKVLKLVKTREAESGAAGGSSGA
jgi:cytoskeletal protein CcmA (bactofilin family)